MLAPLLAEFLGHVVSAQELAPSTTKLEALNILLLPTNVTEVKSFFGLPSCYRRLA